MLPEFAAIENPAIFWAGALLVALTVGFAKSGVPGVGIMVIPVVAMLFHPKQSPGILLPMLVVGDIFALFYYKRHAVWKHVIRALPWGFAGIIIGWLMLNFIDFSPEIEDLQESDDNFLKANILKPDIWDQALAIARRKLGAKEPGNILYGAALNLLLFSNTYRDDVVEKLKTTLLHDNCIFSVSTNVFTEKIAILEKAADNLMFARSEKPMKLLFKMQRMKNAPFFNDEARVPLSEQELKSLRSEAESARKHLIPIISKI